MFGVLAFAPTFLAQRHGLGTGAAGAAIALFGVGGFLYSRLAKQLLGGLGERGLAGAGGTLGGASLLTLAWAGHWLVVLPACLLAGGGFYILHTTLQTQATQMAPGRRGTAMVWFACLLFIGQSVGILAVFAGRGPGSGGAGHQCLCRRSRGPRRGRRAGCRHACAGTGLSAIRPA